MQQILPASGLYTDFYELTMAQGYFCAGMTDSVACFDYFFRKNPFDGGCAVFAGLDDLLDVLENLRFDADDIAFLSHYDFRPDFLDWLA